LFGKKGFIMENSDVICTCFNITVEDVKNAIKNGASSFEDVQNATQLGNACGICIEDAKKTVEELLA
jgi:bacterioferritin-associated ferredoxin